MSRIYNRYRQRNVTEESAADIDRRHRDAVNATVIGLDKAPEGYAAFDSGVAQKFVLDPHGMVPAA